MQQLTSPDGEPYRFQEDEHFASWQAEAERETECPRELRHYLFRAAFLWGNIPGWGAPSFWLGRERF